VKLVHDLVQAYRPLSRFGGFTFFRCLSIYSAAVDL